MRIGLLCSVLTLGFVCLGGCSDSHRTNPKINAGAAGTGAGLPREGTTDEVRGMGAIPGPGVNGSATSMSGSTGTVAAAIANPSPAKQLPGPGTPPAPVATAPVRPQEK